MAPKKPTDISTAVPKDWLPLFVWEMHHHYAKQKEFTLAIGGHWEVLFVAGNGAGKSHIFYWNIIMMSLGILPQYPVDPPISVKILMHDFEHGYGKIFTETCLETQYVLNPATGKQKTIGRMLPASTVKKYPSRDDRTLYFNNGSKIFFQTSEQKKRLHSGTNFDVLGCEEEAEYQVYDESKRGLRTAKDGGRILHAFTPPFDDESKNKGPSWTKFQLVDASKDGSNPDVFVVNAAMADNPAITKEFIRKFSRGKTEEQIRVQLYGEYPTWGKLIFPKFQDHLYDKEMKMGNLLPHDFPVPWKDEDFKFEMAVDWHGSKPCAVIWAFEVRCGYYEGLERGDVVVFDELSPLAGKAMTIRETVDACREIEGWRRRRIVRWADPKMKDSNNALVSGFSPWDEFRHCGMRFTEGWNRDPYVGYSIINDFLSGKSKNNPDHPRLFIMEHVKTLRFNMNNHYNVPRKDGTAEPDPKFSDYCVSLKYMMNNKSRKIKKRMDRNQQKYGLTSFASDPHFSPYLNRREQFNGYVSYGRGVDDGADTRHVG